MFYEEFELYPKDDDPAGEYLHDELKIKYYLPHIGDGYENLTEVIIHEWMHGLIDWACGVTEADKDHFIIRLINYD